MLAPWKKSYDKPRQYIKAQTLLCQQRSVWSRLWFFSVVMYGCESWTVKKAEPWKIDAFELWCWRRLESPLDCKEIQPVHPKGIQSWIFIGRTDVEAETPTLWSTDMKNSLLGKAPDAGKDWRQEKKGTTEDKMIEWHYQLDGHEFEQAPGDGDRQGSLAYCIPWRCKQSDTTEQLNWTEKVNLRSWWRLLRQPRINPWLRFTNVSWDCHQKKYLTNWSRELWKLRFPRLFCSKTRWLCESRLLIQDQQKKK